MKRIYTVFAMVLMSVMLFGQNTIDLPTPKKKVKMTLFQALEQRASVRSFSDKKIKNATMSQLLWAAAGVNREDGRRTAPSAMNAQEILVYVCSSDGAYLYNPQRHRLERVSKKDLRKDFAGRQAEVAEAPIFIALVADLNKFKMKDSKTATFAAVDAGYISQNICLACEALGLATVPRGSMDADKIGKALDLSKNQELLINHPVGYEK